MGQFGVGQAVRRTEDNRLITGRGRFTDDIHPEGVLHAVMLRSPVAHARIARIDVEAARKAPGVVAVYTGADVAAAGLGDLKSPVPLVGRDKAPMFKPIRPLIVTDHVKHVGDTVAMVVARSVNFAKDAAELIEVDYDDLPVVADTEQAVVADAPKVWPDATSNVALDWGLGDEEAVDAAIAKAAHVTRVKLINNRVVVNSMEPRAILAEFDGVHDRYDIILGSQGVHMLRGLMAGILNVAPEKIRVRTFDVGGGFGMKAFLYGEYPLVAWAAKSLGHPVKWTGERSDAFISDPQGRDHVTEAALAFDKDHRILGVKVETIANLGAYCSQFGPAIPTVAPAGMHVGVYRVPVLFNRVRLVYTNTTPTDAYRGAGRPEASYVIERLMDKAAREFGLSPAALRRINFVPASAMPYQSPAGVNFDSGDFERNLRDALERADFDGFAERRAVRAGQGLLSGIGLSYYVERTPGGMTEFAAIHVNADENVIVAVGTQSTGQGHETAWAQLVADKLGVPFENIHVMPGDTDILASGSGTGGSRSLYMAKGSIENASDKVIEKGRALAANELEAAEADIVFEDGRFVIAGTDRAIGLFDVARIAASQTEGPTATGLSADASYKHGAVTYPNGCHICEVEIERETGQFRIVRYTVVDDFGKIVNPLLVAGQVHGGIAQGLGQAMGEHAVYDRDTGQLVTGSFMDYWMPRADNMPEVDFSYNEIPCTTNMLGVKGCGEAGTIGATSAFVNAVVDALSGLGVRDIDMPITPLKLWQIIQAQGKKSA